MPDPIASSSSSPDLSCNFDDSLPLTCQTEAAASSVGAPNECLLPDAPATSSAASALVRKFARTPQATLVAAPASLGPAPSPPGVVSLRPDQVDLQAGIPRVQAHAAWGSLELRAAVDILNANAHVGSLNGDGSRGENIGAGANLIGGELGIDYKGWSLTLGVATSLGGSISSGEGRDMDGDGVQEHCFAMSLGPFTLGECDEL